ncbi:MAG TPA: aspartate-semialdehyde dehydrogenase [Acidiferrobacteraceae bacterium]|nr:aspartate-semialdehyde dehydrogenase [Acidiferrobacteraceae bacterium]
MSLRVAVVGATGAVGAEFIKLLERRAFPVEKLTLLASARSAGQTLHFRGQPIVVEELTRDSFGAIDLAFFSAGASVSKEFCPAAAAAGALVIDNSSAFRMDPKVPLVVPEVNPETIGTHQGIIANPNCTTIQMVVVLKPLHDAARIKRVVVSTYQAVSGTGTKAIVELEQQVQDHVAGRPPQHAVYPVPIAFNVLPHVDVFLDNGYTKEEMKMVHETRKIMGDANINVSATCVRVPVVRAHSEAINIETERKLTAAEARTLLTKAPGVVVKDDPGPGGYPVPLAIAEQYDTYVGRIREDISVQNGLAFWVVADQLFKGAALNGIQIAEYAIAHKLLVRKTH